MTLNNFEKKLKEQLKQREITPSERAWDEISAELEEHSTPAAKSNYFWYGIAAGFIGLLIVSVIYLTSSDPIRENDIQVVGSPEEERVKEQVILPEEPDKEVQQLIKNKTEEVTTEVAVEKPRKVSQDFDQASEIAITQSEVKQTAPKVIPAPTENIIDTKLMEVIAQVDLMEKDQDRLTELEVDSLLRQAQKEILTEQLFNQDNSVDAMALLNQVEDELDQSFRDQIFEKLKTGFIKVRTAVADRNN